MTLPPSAERRAEVTTRALGRRSWERTQATSCPYRPYGVFRSSYTARRVHVNSCMVAPQSRFTGTQLGLLVYIDIHITCRYGSFACHRPMSWTCSSGMAAVRPQCHEML